MRTGGRGAIVQASHAGAMSSQQAAYSATLTSELLIPDDKSQNPILFAVSLFADKLALSSSPSTLPEFV